MKEAAEQDLKSFKESVDLAKVQEASDFLRKTYINRKNVGKIHASWDEQKTGTISTQNVYNMCKKLGLKLNMNESRVLVSNATKGSSNVLDANQFLRLIDSKERVSDTDMKTLARNLLFNLLLNRLKLKTFFRINVDSLKACLHLS